jgi:hypothetical protein
MTKIVAKIWLHGGWTHPCDALRTHSAASVPCYWAMESFTKPKKYAKRKRSKNRRMIFTNKGVV